MNKREFEDFQLEIVELEVHDVIATSGNEQYQDGGNPWTPEP